MIDQPRFELFAFWRTSATYRVRVAMALKGLAATETQVNLIAGGQHDPAFVAVNPMAAIPALIDRSPGAPDTALTQSLAILEFLEEVAPTPAILPMNPYARARVRSLTLLLAADTHPFITPRVRKALGMVAPVDDAAWKVWQTYFLTIGLQGFEK
ncbi:MAG: glutathione S-transferase N-terminal domain-containing protein, partial [Janthinobacterium lividum]